MTFHQMKKEWLLIITIFAILIFKSIAQTKTATRRDQLPPTKS